MTTRWVVDLLDRNNHSKGELARVRSGSLDWADDRTIRGAGSIELSTPRITANWASDRIRVSHEVDGQRTAVGTYLPSVPKNQTDGPVTHLNIGLSDLTAIVNSAAGAWVTYPVGTQVVPTVVEILKARGLTATLVTESTAKLGAALSWEPKDTWLSIANGLLAAIGYEPLHADPLGVIVAAPYVAPADRPVVAAYGAAGAAMTSAWEDEADLDCPTGVVIYVEGDEETPGIVGRADLPDSHPLSAASRGREILQTDSGEAVDKKAADALATAALNSAVEITRTITITHPVDSTELGDVLTHQPKNVTGPIAARTIRLELGAVVTDTVRRIYLPGESLEWL